MEEKFTMFDLADKLGWKYLQRSNGYIKCPFPDCGTEELKCNITKTFFHCYNCGRGGNYYSIFAELFGIQAEDGKSATQNARKEILKLLGSDYITEPRDSIQKTNAVNIPERKKEDIDNVYCSLIKHTSLSKKHKEALLKRGLTEKQIESYGFRSVDNSRSAAICRLIQKEGISLNGIPGFYYDKFNREWTINTFGMDGYVCICPDENGLLQGFQIRLDIPKNGQKYLWLSSKNKPYGATSGSPSAYFGSLNAKKIVVVDGILKAAVCQCLSNDRNTAFMGVAGVNNYKNARAMIKRLAKRGIEIIYNAYDMDEFINPICNLDNKHCKNCKHNSDLIRCECEYKLKKIKSLKDGSKHLEEIAREFGLSYERITWDMGKNGYWMENIKGLDDYLYSLIKERGCKNEVL